MQRLQEDIHPRGGGFGFTTFCDTWAETQQKLIF